MTVAAATPARVVRLRLPWIAGGVAANAALGNWLVKGEAAVFDGLRFRDAPGETFTRLDALVGEDGPRGLEDPLAVAPRVRPQRTGRGHGDGRDGRARHGSESTSLTTGIQVPYGSQLKAELRFR